MTSETIASDKPRILIVEDDPVNVELMRAQLHGEGYSVDSVSDGGKALAKVSEEMPDLVLLDIMLPGKNGFEICKEMKGTTATRSIPVIMVTSLDDMESRVKGISAGADDFLTRPVDRSELVARVKSMLRIRRLYEELARESQSVRESGEKLQLQQRVLKSMSAQLMHASHLKYEFIVNMSHALRTPLNVIIGFSEMLQDRLVGELNEKQAKYVENVSGSGRELQRLITNIVDVFKIDTGKVPLETTEFLLENAIDAVLAEFGPVAREKNIKVSLQVAPEVSRICADPQKLSTIMDGLLSNAFKFTQEGGRIDICADLREDHTRICVADTGPSLSLEDCENVFKEFYKVPDPAVSAWSGSGLGLAIVKKLVLMHGGDIWAESEEGTGAKFIFTLPCREK
ncbi:MAG: hybrid sensor histidine kinase/response regulator [Candidatus Abyssubacteria bacterium]|nr:hybrid sensor histidine kinase/response regulator [Candidatus Abyssubacteria bacterium]